MAKLTYSENMFGNNNSNNNSRSKVGYFSLKNNNDEAIVRFMCDSTDDFEIFNVHDATFPDSKYPKQVNCLRLPTESISNCPMCEAQAKLTKKFYVHLIQYTKDPNTGGVVAEPKVWSRPLSFAFKLKDYLDNYGPLSDMICKVVRHGEANSKETSYEIIPNLSKTIYRDDIFVKDESLLGDYTALGHAVYNKTYAEMYEYLSTGSFPVKAQAQATEPTAYAPKAPVTTQVATQATQQPTVSAEPVKPAVAPWETPVAESPRVNTPASTPIQTNKAPWEASDNSLPF